MAESITDRKLKRVKQLLKGSKAQIKDVFRQSGFGNIAYATKLFRETVGMTPENWRKGQYAAAAGTMAAASRQSGQLERLTDISGADAAPLQQWKCRWARVIPPE